mgnify:FL=1
MDNSAKQAMNIVGVVCGVVALAVFSFVKPEIPDEEDENEEDTEVQSGMSQRMDTLPASTREVERRHLLGEDSSLHNG